MTEQSTSAAPLAWLPGPLLADFPDKTAKMIDYGSDGIVVIHFKGQVTAFRNSCLHQDMPIHAGYLTGDGMLLCPWHNWCYDVTTGNCITVSGAGLQQYPVRIADERVWVGVKDGNPTTAGAGG